MVLTYNYDDARPEKDWVLKTGHNFDGDSLSYLDMMERNNEEERRRARERQIMEEGRTLWQQRKQEEQEIYYRDMQEAKELAREKMFGRPGHGAPTEDIRKKKFTEYQLDNNLKRSQSMFGMDQFEDLGVGRPQRLAGRSTSVMDLEESDALKFGRPGYGAPVRTKSGRLRTSITGNPEIRFQANESVQKTICNNIRYAMDPQEKALYHKELEMQIQERKQMQEMEKQNELFIIKQQEEHEGTQWGRPGPGGAYWRSSAVTGQGFFDKMGWSGSADPRKRHPGIKRSEAEEIKKDIEDLGRRKYDEHREVTSDEGLELVPLMKDKYTGKPKKDPSTGYMMSHSLSSTDITKHADKKGPQPWHSQGNKRQYWEQLTGQVSEKEDHNIQRKQMEDEQQRRHFQSWESFWGRPGYGAPNASTNKENLMKMLHYPESAAKNAPKNVELITLERLPVK